ncbi:MAG: AAA family ATPase, partial [Candidatus Ornithospirochaeta sp.]
MFIYTDKKGYVFEITSFRGKDENGKSIVKKNRVSIGKMDENGEFRPNAFYVERAKKENLEKELESVRKNLKLEMKENTERQICKKLPIGIDDFKEIREEDFYYVDKTSLIRDLLNNWGKVNLFTRPRRFGKTLNMSMLKYFFEIGTDESLFEGLSISREKDLCDKHMGKYPVIFISLKSVEGINFEEAYAALRSIIRRELSRLGLIIRSGSIADEDKNVLLRILQEEETYNDIRDSLLVLSSALRQYYGKKVILLIDEYDVPLDKAFKHGYYREMVSLIRSLFGNALKSNDSLQFAVLTGCLRVSKESIFTGLNNFKTLSITDTRFDEQFGFMESEVRQILYDYHIEDHLSEAKEWYDGYRFGERDIYCPWDVINYVDLISANPKAKPESFWINSSGNDLVKRFIDK